MERGPFPLVTMDELIEDEMPEDVPGVDLERLSARAREAMSAAAVEAQRLGDQFVGTDHVLLGLSQIEQCAARNVLESVDLTTERLEHSIRFIRGESNGASDLEMGYSPRLLRVLTAASKDAAKALQPEIGTIHILSGLLREGGGLAVFLLESAGLSTKRADQVLDIAIREGWTD
jgi:ATP-dependent Clp protease ATP-binding subunit ClpC